ncbi:MFS transporter [Halioxenophilus sp. WMMB6]|uniref:MFS transporter n=1 Tax=Halioxenophilus sp. WMMB6 TaxID=3073815 RepID=UPI00295ED11C|nr:MFS transporter [Halioxenophilus sp. WMMB6]
MTSDTLSPDINLDATTHLQFGSYNDCINQLRALINENSMSLLQILVVLLCFALNMLDGMDVVLMSYAAPALAEDWNIPAAALGAVFSAALIGMTFGCLAIAPYADIIGRRKMILIAVFIIASGMLLSGISQSIAQLAAARVYTGLGVGAILASMAAMVAEYSSDKHRNLCVAFLQAGYPIGAVFTGFVSAEIIPLHGWRPMFFWASTITVSMLPIMFWLMPESLEFLAKKQPKNALRDINKTLSKIGAPKLAQLPEQPHDAHHKTSVKALFEGSRKHSTIMLWTGVMLGFFTLYFVISWIPKIAVDAGLPLDKGIYAGTAYNLGSCIGSIFLGWISTRFGLQRMIFIFFSIAAVMLMIFGSVSMNVFFILLCAFVIGITLNGGFNGFWPTAARLYPTEIRATGVGWAVGAGRAGAVLGPLVGGYLLQSGAGLAITFTVFSIPLFLAGLATLCIRSSDFA